MDLFKITIHLFEKGFGKGKVFAGSSTYYVLAKATDVALKKAFTRADKDEHNAGITEMLCMRLERLADGEVVQ